MQITYTPIICKKNWLNTNTFSKQPYTHTQLSCSSVHFPRGCECTLPLFQCICLFPVPLGFGSSINPTGAWELHQRESCLPYSNEIGRETNERDRKEWDAEVGSGRWEKGREQSLMSGRKEKHFVILEGKREIKSCTDITAFLFPFVLGPCPPPPLQSESPFGSSTHRTPRWGSSSTPSTQWHMACITCSGLSAQVIRYGWDEWIEGHYDSKRWRGWRVGTMGKKKVPNGFLRPLFPQVHIYLCQGGCVFIAVCLPVC